MRFRKPEIRQVSANGFHLKTPAFLIFWLWHVLCNRRSHNIVTAIERSQFFAIKESQFNLDRKTRRRN